MFLLFLALTFDTIKQLPKRDMRQNITPQVAAGKPVGLAGAVQPCRQDAAEDG